MRLQLSQVDVETAALQREVAEQQAKIADLKKMITTAPEVEAEFARLNRDYDVTRGAYQSLVDRLNRAKLSDKADATGVTRFEVVDPPTANAEPVSPDRPRLILMVLFGGLAAGIGVAYVMHQLRPVFTSARQLTELTQLPVLGVVSMTWVERHKAVERRAMWTYSIATGVLVVLAIVTLLTQNVTAQFLRGLIA
jgi:capsular polysaccharide biosynthesis protein